MYILIECVDGTRRIRKKAAIRDVKPYSTMLNGNLVKCSLVSFYGKNVTPLCAVESVTDFYYHVLGEGPK